MRDLAAIRRRLAASEGDPDLRRLLATAPTVELRDADYRDRLRHLRRRHTESGLAPDAWLATVRAAAPRPGPSVWISIVDAGYDTPLALLVSLPFGVWLVADHGEGVEVRPLVRPATGTDVAIEALATEWWGSALRGGSAVQAAPRRRLALDVAVSRSPSGIGTAHLAGRAREIADAIVAHVTATLRRSPVADSSPVFLEPTEGEGVLVLDFGGCVDLATFVSPSGWRSTGRDLVAVHAQRREDFRRRLEALGVGLDRHDGAGAVVAPLIPRRLALDTTGVSASAGETP